MYVEPAVTAQEVRLDEWEIATAMGEQQGETSTVLTHWCHWYDVFRLEELSRRHTVAPTLALSDTYRLIPPVMYLGTGGTETFWTETGAEHAGPGATPQGYQVSFRTPPKRVGRKIPIVGRRKGTPMRVETEELAFSEEDATSVSIGPTHSGRTLRVVERRKGKPRRVDPEQLDEW